MRPKSISDWKKESETLRNEVQDEVHTSRNPAKEKAASGRKVEKQSIRKRSRKAGRQSIGRERIQIRTSRNSAKRKAASGRKVKKQSIETRSRKAGRQSIGRERTQIRTSRNSAKGKVFRQSRLRKPKGAKEIEQGVDDEIVADDDLWVPLVLSRDENESTSKPKLKKLKSELTSEPKPEPKPESKSEPKPEPKLEPKPEPKPEPKILPEHKSEVSSVPSRPPPAAVQLFKPWPEPNPSSSKTFFIEVLQEQQSELFQQFKKAAGLMPRTYTSIFFEILANEKFLIALFALRDHSPIGSIEREYADFSLQSFERGLMKYQHKIVTDLHRFLPKWPTITPRQQNWIIFLTGGTVEHTTYWSACRNIRWALNTNDATLERLHDFIQILFPSWNPSEYANQDLYISAMQNIFANLLHNSRFIASTMRVCVMISFYRMIWFWGLHFEFTETGSVMLKDNLLSILHATKNHNHKRLTRMISCLKIMECNLACNLIKDLIYKNYCNSPVCAYWLNALKQKSPFGTLPKATVNELLKDCGRYVGK
ncbi:MAG: hypothetical protein LBH08_03700 [Puniceicoccales bacterium]|nr:hypothetical protein [Puniceicoccales bacterium]